MASAISRIGIEVQTSKEKTMKRKRMLVQTVLLTMVVALLASPLVAVGSTTYNAAAVPGIGTQGGPIAAPHVPTGSGFTYHGQLKQGGNPTNGQYDFTFALYDASSGGAQVGST